MQQFQLAQLQHSPPFPPAQVETQPCPWLVLGKGGGCASTPPGPVDTDSSQFSLHPHCLQPAQGWGPGASVPGPGWSQRTVTGTSSVGGSQVLYWAQLHLLPPSGGQSYRGAGGRVRGRWRGVSVNPRCPPWFPWRSCKSQCHHWQSRPGGVCCEPGAEALAGRALGNTGPGSSGTAPRVWPGQSGRPAESP